MRPYSGSVQEPEFQTWLKHANCPVEHIVRIRNAMETADPYSVDAFLESQKLEIQQAGKVAIALTLLRFEEDGGNGSERLNPRRYSEKFHRNANPQEVARAEDHWYQYLAHFLSSGVSKEHFADHKLSIVTFNYDRSLEEYLYRVLGARYDCDAHDLVKTIPVVHLHGSLGPLEWESPGGRQYGGPFDMKAVLPVAAGSLNIVSDEIPEDDKAFTKAREKLSEAKYVGFLGFGYHEASLRRLQFRDLTRTAVRFGTRKGLRAAEWATAG